MKTSVYQEITNQIIHELENGTAPWVKPWNSPRGFNDIPNNAVSKRGYTGINVLLLWMNCAIRGYDVPAFVTFKQAKAAGGHVRKGERGFRVVYASTFDKKIEGATGETEVQTIPFLKSYTVFNVDQCEDLPFEWYRQPEPRPMALINDDFQRFVVATRATIRHKGDKAFHSSQGNFIQMPHPFDFAEHSGYQSTLLHELGHWTGGESRLKRQLGNRFKSKAYAAEELIAELTSAYLCAHLGIKGELRHAAYIESWITMLRDDPRAIFTAASKASKAADYLRAFSEVKELEAA